MTDSTVYYVSIGLSSSLCLSIYIKYDKKPKYLFITTNKDLKDKINLLWSDHWERKDIFLSKVLSFNSLS